MPYAIHLRKSRADLEAEARGEGESLARHRARLLAFAERAGLPIVAEYARSSPATAFPTVRRSSVFLPTLLPECTTAC